MYLPALHSVCALPPVNYMRKRDGFWGLYRGSTSRIVCHLVSGCTFHQVTSRITFKVSGPRCHTGTGWKGMTWVRTAREETVLSTGLMKRS